MTFCFDGGAGFDVNCFGQNDGFGECYGGSVFVLDVRDRAGKCACGDNVCRKRVGNNVE